MRPQGRKDGERLNPEKLLPDAKPRKLMEVEDPASQFSAEKVPKSFMEE